MEGLGAQTFFSDHVKYLRTNAVGGTGWNEKSFKNHILVIIVIIVKLNLCNLLELNLNIHTTITKISEN